MRSGNLEADNSLTDSFPVCHSTGAGSSTNQTYKNDGTRHEGHTSYDRSFHCQQIDDQTCLYAIFSGQNGCNIAHIAIQKISAEILLGQLKSCSSSEAIKDLLRQAFITVEKDYLLSIDSTLAEKARLQANLQNDSLNEVSRNILEQIADINFYLSMGASAVLALIYKSKLYICNIGNCRALLCKSDDKNVLRVIQLSVDHNISNDEEKQRVNELGLDLQAFEDGPFESTRCVGCYIGKAGYKDAYFFSGAKSEPILSKPEIVGPIALDESCRFLVLMSGGLCKTLREIYRNETNIVNREIIQIIVDQFRQQSTLSGVSQSAIHKLVQLHHDAYMREVENPQFGKRDDITLLVRNFNYAMPNAIQRLRNNVTFNPVIEEHRNGTVASSETNSITDTTNSYYTNTNSSTSSIGRQSFNRNTRILPYVDFSEYRRLVERSRADGSLPDFPDFD